MEKPSWNRCSTPISTSNLKKDGTLLLLAIRAYTTGLVLIVVPQGLELRNDMLG